ncbi:MAG: AAA family ATPase [Myxococcota bacterium]|nr:AAA family ATPase [Myxococcota bacterium]
MYTAFYGLREKPFSLTPNPAFLYLSDSHREALAHLVYGLEQGEGFIVLAGEVGTGKTTLCRSLLERIEADTEIAILFNPSNNDIELLQSISEEFGLVAERRSRRQLLAALNEFLLECHGRQRRVVLIVDEAQNLSSGTLEQIRLLSNLETASSKLIQIVLLGQPELETKLDSDSLRQLRQRITVRWSLRAFLPRETAAYVGHRLYVAAGADREIFTPGALREVHRLTGGVPRLINVLCDRALLLGYAEGAHRIGNRWVRRASREVPDSARRIGARAPARRAWAMAAGLVLAALMGYASFRFGPEVAALLGRGSAGEGGLAPVALARAPEFVGSAEIEPPQASGAAVTVIVELPPSDFGHPPSDADPAPVAEPVGARANASEAQRTHLEPAEEGAFLSAVLAGQAPEAAAEAATGVALGLYGVRRSANPVSSLDEALAEIRAQGLDVLELPEASFRTLRDLNYPALIRLSSPTGEPRVAVLVGIEPGRAELMGIGNRTPLTVSIEVVEEHWDGLAWVVWNPYLDLPHVISQGARGDEVRWLQSALSRLGYLDAHIPGVYDISTLRGVVRFQGQHAVAPDGVAGPRTQMLIYAALDEFAPPQLADEDSG